MPTSDPGFWDNIVNWGWSAVGGAFVWILGLQKSLGSHKTHVAEKYVPKDDYRSDQARVARTLEKMDEKLDRLIDRNRNG